ncbi:MAG: hypothetical protein QF886_01670, partial [Planctomycetota bacterium]|nr:hypothetical protein [Planctomycetota bacterium]
MSKWQRFLSLRCRQLVNLTKQAKEWGQFSGGMFPLSIVSKALSQVTARMLIHLLAKSSQGTCATCEACFFHTHVVKHTEVKVRQWGVVLAVECKVLSVFKASSRQDDRKVFVVVNVGIAHVAAIKNHGL